MTPPPDPSTPAAPSPARGPKPAPDPALPRLAYTLKEAGAVLGVSDWMVRELVRAGDLTALRLGPRGGRILIPAADLAAFVADAAAAATAERAQRRALARQFAPPFPIAKRARRAAS